MTNLEKFNDLKVLISNLANTGHVIINESGNDSIYFQDTEKRSHSLEIIGGSLFLTHNIRLKDPGFSSNTEGYNEEGDDVSADLIIGIITCESGYHMSPDTLKHPTIKSKIENFKASFLKNNIKPLESTTIQTSNIMTTTTKTSSANEPLSFKANNVRSLALSLAKRFSGDQKKGWETAKKIADKNESFDTDSIEAQLLELTSNKPVSKPKTSPEAKPKAETSETGETKNDIIRRRILSGESLSDIRKDLGVIYQRVKNVYKDMKKKGLVS